MRSIKTIFSLAIAAALVAATGGCATAPPKEIEKPVPYAVAVATGCIDSRGRPAVPQSLKQRYTPDQWAALSPGAKAFAIEAQAGRRLNYEQLDRAATSGCTLAKPVSP